VIGRILHAWAVSVAMEHTRDHDTIVAVHILLSLFMAEAPPTESYEELCAFWCRWTDRCIKRLSRGMVLSELVFRGSSECVSPKWGSIVSRPPSLSPMRSSARIELWH
jgi:hypothetical protein